MRIFKPVANPERIMVYIRDPEKKNIFLVIKELFILTFDKKEIPYYYFKHIYKKEVANILDYLGTKERARIHQDPQLQKYEHISIIQNKLNFAVYCEKHGLRSPRAIGYNFSNRFVFQGKVQKINSIDDLISYFKTILNEENLIELFVRPIMLMKGAGCFKLTLHDLEVTLNQQKESLFNGSYIYTKVILQHPKVNEIHEKSINTLRLLTYITDEGHIKVISGAMRFGINDSVVDNSNFGGFFVGINLKNGTFKKAGWNGVAFGRKKITHHPNSGFKLEGFKVPFFREGYDMVVEYTRHIPNKLIGWDVAIGPDGPIIIEANHDPSLFLSDIANEGLLKNKHFNKLIQEVNGR